MNIEITGINDRQISLPDWCNDVPKTYLLLKEFPMTQETASSIFSLINNRKAPYYSTRAGFSEYVNNYFNSAFGFKVNSMIIDLVYEMKDKYVYCYPIGCIDQPGSENTINDMKRFNRSVAITNNCLGILKDYQKTIDLRIMDMDALFEKLGQSQELKKIYVQGSKLKFLKEVMNYFFLYSGVLLEKPNCKVSKEVLEDMINVSFDCSGNDKVYINPLTYSKIYYEAKNSFSPENVGIYVGEPHRVFLEYYLSKHFPQVSSVSKTLDFMQTSIDTPYVKKDIELAETMGLIGL
jgi:hypothetical protein